ncbi:excisionase [Lachnospiraceae bacterium C1.1]|nr:excisionase [Lachnospiraceae bacterium C1.1]
MSGCIWKYSQYLDDEDIVFAQKRFVTYKLAGEYYGINQKPLIRMVWASGAVYKIGKKVLISRKIFEEYLRENQRIVNELIDEDDEKLLKAFESRVKEGESYEY